MSYREEFPDFDPADMPTLPQGFDDVSWHNNSAPSFRSSGLMLEIWVDYADPSLSEWPEDRKSGALKRFMVHRIDQEGAFVSDEAELQTDDWSEVLAFVLAEAFVAECRDTFTEEQLAEIKARNASPNYAGEVCATHDFADANMIMLEAFSATFGREPVFLIEGPDAPASAPDLALWGAAWARAKQEHLTGTPLDALVAEFTDFCEGEAFAGEGDALELLMMADQGEVALTAHQRSWLEAFVERWKVAQAAEDAKAA